ncbi:hypothetical protein [Amycolatopsis sp. NPDC059657]|uniref:hypothetical protein n=1 Tax=Amycolatopsis sp. NPDC059657 TaxID=3346899 RepID=UPI0036723AAB
MSEPADVAEKPNPHAESVLKLAGAMQKATLVVVPPLIAICAVIFLIAKGTPGLLGALVGGAIALASSLVTIGMMRFSAGMDPMFVMVIALGGYIVKILVLFVALNLLRGVESLQPLALGITMLSVIVIAAAVEVRAYKRTKIPTIIPN